MFGDKIAVFTDFGYTFIAVIQMLVGSSRTGGNSRSRRGGGSAVLQGVDYPDIKKVARETAWIFYYPFVFVMAFVVLNITIAIIGEAYERVKATRDPKAADFSLCPSEGRAGKPMPVMEQVRWHVDGDWSSISRKQLCGRQREVLVLMILCVFVCVHVSTCVCIHTCTTCVFVLCRSSS